MFITFEGLDFSGKSTQAKLFVERVRSEGYPVLLERDPGGTAIGETIRRVLLDPSSSGMAEVTELLLFSASRAQLVHEVIGPALRKGTVVVCDRFYDSTTAYQGWGRGLPVEEIKTINRVAAQGFVPDLSLFFDIPVEELHRRMKQQRSSADRMESSGSEFYEKVRKGYLKLAEEEPRFMVLDGMKPVEELHAIAWERFQALRLSTSKTRKV
jgi:dTMP kinase